MFRIDVGDGIEMHLLEERHAEALFRLSRANLERLRDWLPWAEANRTAEDVRAYIRATLFQFAENNGFACGIWVAGELRGGIGVHHINHADRHTSLGYWLDIRNEGNGVVTRCVHALLDYLFGELRLHRVEIRCAPGNSRSAAIPERLGFTREGILREAQWVNGRYLDLVVYSLLADEWKPGRAAPR